MKLLGTQDGTYVVPFIAMSRVGQGGDGDGEADQGGDRQARAGRA